jgi:signal transduction histidine kinase
LARIETQNKLQEQRLRISRDLHDNIGSQLTFIISSIDSLKFGLRNAEEKTMDKLTGISNFASQTIFELRDTIWAMNKNDITCEDLQARISNFIEKAGTAKNEITFNFSVAETICKDAKFTSIQGMNIYRIIQEAVNNALKHANATNINVHIDKEGATYHIQIEDNGRGFDVQRISGGNGVKNMEKRAKEIAGALTISSKIGLGTTIEVSFV